MDGASYSQAFKGTSWDGSSSFYDFATDTFPAGFVYKVYSTLLKAGYRVNLVRKPAPAPLGPERPEVDSFGYDPRYAYQPEVADKLVKHRQIIARVATGGGKSRIARICYKRINRATLFLTTRGILMYQMGEAVTENLGERVGIVGDSQRDYSRQFTLGMVQTISQAIEKWTDEGELLAFMKNREAAEDREVEKQHARLKRQKATTTEIAEATTTLRRQLVAARQPDAVVVAEIQAKVKEHNRKREEMIAFLSKIEFVILEEAHEASGAGFYEIMRHCVNAHYRLALTATPFMKDSQEANMRLEACSGPVAITVTEKQLIDLGVLATPYFKFIRLQNPAPQYEEMVESKGLTRKVTHRLFRSTPWPKCLEIGVVHNEERNRAIVYEVQRAAAHGLPSMILVGRKDHGRQLSDMLTQAGIRCNFIFGEHDQDERKAALAALGDGRIQALIGSTILDVGVDVPAVGMIVLAGAGKAEVQTRQRIGRGLRAKKGGPNVAFVVDFIEAANTTLRDHQVERMQIIQNTPGFAEHIVGDFDYSVFRKAA
ncbi:DEAD/DEAH box helicase [Paraburkholderia sp. RCC_158]|uniref:DEAD/DEAH box helicase n=1 Tax=Paraburkholderia sp. RCC_158 TaxID=3239220 RepID=UPI00352573CE